MTIAAAAPVAPEQALPARRPGSPDKRDRSAPVQDRHHIANPLGSIEALSSWENTLMKERISDVCRTERGFKGHLEQIQTELNRISRDAIRKTEGVTPEVAEGVQRASRRLYVACKKAIEEGMKKYPNLEGTLDFPHYDKIVVGKVKVH